MPVLLLPRPARRGSVLVERAPRPCPIAPRVAALLMRQAERDPRLDLEACAVLRALLFNFTAWRTGHCAPSLVQIARVAKVSRATACRRLALLCSPAIGLLRRVRRGVLVDARTGWRGLARFCQTTTAYFFPTAAAAPARPDCESQGEPLISLSLNSLMNPSAPRRRACEGDGQLEAALARLGRAVALRS